MGYRSLAQCAADLEKRGMLRRLDCELDADLELAAIQRRVVARGGPALLFTRVRNSRFPMLGNLFGTLERTRFIFRDTLADIDLLVDLKVAPRAVIKNPLRLRFLPRAASHLFPWRCQSGPVMQRRTVVSRLPQLKSWPRDGGAFITLPQVYSEDPDRPGWRHSNLGMYRVQLSGGQYRPDEEIGLHYQLHRGIGLHQAAACGRPMRVNIFVGGPPALTVAAVMPLPDELPELSFAGLLGGHCLRMVQPDGCLPMPAEADFCICAVLVPGRLLPEGPFGDHLGYYSLKHDFPVLKVERVYHRPAAVWPFTVVGRPPQEDTVFGKFIHELTDRLIPQVLPGVAGVQAVDDAGVHPLLLVLGSERYLPFMEKTEPREQLTQANAVLGQGQLSLAKYLLIVAREDNPDLKVNDTAAFFSHLLERVDWQRDLHFQTRTTIDTLDYSGSGFNQGSKLVVAALGPRRRELGQSWPGDYPLPDGFRNPRLVMPGIAVVAGPACGDLARSEVVAAVRRLTAGAGASLRRAGVALVVVVDDSEFAARSLANFIWVTFTRSDPARDVYGFAARSIDKHWGCAGPLVIDARIKSGHAPALEEDPATRRRLEGLAVKGGPLAGLF